MKNRRSWKTKLVFLLSVSMLVNLCFPSLAMTGITYEKLEENIASGSNAVQENPIHKLDGVMTKESQTLQELSQIYNDVTVTVKEMEAGALSGVTGIRVEDTDAYTEDVQNQIEASLRTGGTVAHYAAYDITLIGTDEDGNEVEMEPGDKVSVAISGISLDEDMEYNRVKVYHLSERQKPNRAMGRPSFQASDQVNGGGRDGISGR